MQDQPVRIDRTQVLKDAEAALVAHRVYIARRMAALDALHPFPTDAEVEQWRQAWPSTLTTEAEVVVDTVIRSIETSGVHLTRAEAGHAADWHDYVVDMGGDMPAEETEIALRLRRGAAS